MDDQNSHGPHLLGNGQGARHTNADVRDPGTALLLDGQYDYVSAPREALNGLGDFTFAQRVRLDSERNGASLSCLISAAASDSANKDLP